MADREPANLATTEGFGSSDQSVGTALFSFLSERPESERKGPIIIFTHRQADPDALCSAFALARFVSTSSNQMANSKGAFAPVPDSAKIIAPKGSSILGSKVSRTLEIHFQSEITEEEILGALIIAAVDLGDPMLLEPYTALIMKSKAIKILIDHHSSTPSYGGQGIFNNVFIDKDATSTCEILAEGYPQGALDEKVARALLVGLLFDSQHLGIATYNTLAAAQKLLKEGPRIDEAKEILRQKPERSEIIARLKAAQRLKYMEIGKYIVVQSELSSFQAAVARMLIEIGADVGIAYGKNEEEVRVSVRTTQRFFRETMIDMGVLLGNVSDEMFLTGGGHSTAASISGKAEPNIVVRKIISYIEKVCAP